MIESHSAKSCYSTEDYNEIQNGLTNIIEEKLIPEWFSGGIALTVKIIRSLLITCVRINPRINSYYHAIIVRVFLVTFIKIVLALHAPVSVM